MSISVSHHHHFRWLNLLMRHLAIPSGHSTPVEQPDTDDQRDGGLQANFTPAPTGQSPPHQAAEPTIDQEDAARAGTSDGRQAQGPLPLQANSAPTGQSAVEHGTLMRCKKVRLIMNPRAGHHFTRISDVLAVFSAAGW